MSDIIEYPYCIYYKININEHDDVYYPISVATKTIIEKKKYFETCFDFELNHIDNLSFNLFISTKNDKESFDDIVKFFGSFIEICHNHSYDLFMKIYKRCTNSSFDIVKIHKFIKYVKLILTDNNYCNEFNINEYEINILNNLNEDILTKNTTDLLYYQNFQDKKMYKLYQVDADKLPTYFPFKTCSLDYRMTELMIDYIKHCKYRDDEEFKEIFRNDIIKSRVNVFFNVDFEDDKLDSKMDEKDKIIKRLKSRLSNRNKELLNIINKLKDELLDAHDKIKSFKNANKNKRKKSLKNSSLLLADLDNLHRVKRKK